MRMYDIIAKKRDGYELTKREIKFFINKYTNGEIPDYQASALLMAIYFQNMSDRELGYFTAAMANSGEIIDLSAIDGIKVDKHSTGGVGDKTTLILIPLVASLGIPIPKMSGRGLGHTGGTLDKLEAIPNFNIELTSDTFIKNVNEHKLAVVGQTATLAPADQKLYHLRDVTATVHSIPLIASSIMSKKIASGADALVLDVKTGTGTFMEKLADAKLLAQAMVSIGKQVNKQTVAVISNMNQPLGKAIGNSLEVIEAIDTLKGKGPKDVTELCLTLGSYMVVLANKAKNTEEARRLLQESLQSGKALTYFKKLIKAQGGDDKVIDDYERLPQAKYTYELRAKKAGFVTAMNTEQLGVAAMMLGAGRKTVDAKIDLGVGIVLHKKIGDYVAKDESLLTIYSNDPSVEQVKEKLLHNIIIPMEKGATDPSQSLIYDVITS